MLGFNAEFPLKMKLSARQEMQLKKGVSYNLSTSGNKVNIVLFSNNLRIQINKRYTVLGKFLKLKAE